MILLKRWRLLLPLCAVFILLSTSAVIHRLDRTPAWYRKLLFKATGRQVLPSVDQDIVDMMVDIGFKGLSPDYMEREYTTDFEQRGGNNFTVEPISGLAPASIFQGLSAAQPNADVVQGIPQYRGLRCLSKYPLSACPFPLQCPPPSLLAPQHQKASLCASWGEGLPDGLQKALDRGMAQGSHKSPPRVWDWGVPGVWKGPYWTPTKFPERPYRIFSPADANMCLKDKTVFFIGDSMVRQNYVRLIHFLRGIPTACEHVWNWGTSFYGAYKNGTDFYQPACDGKVCSYPSDPLYKIIFEWHDDKHPSVNIDRIIDRKPDIAVLGLVYWIDPDVDYTNIQNEIRRLYESGWDGALSWFMTPERTLDGQQYGWRNSEMRKFIADFKEKNGKAINGIPVDQICTPSSGCTLERNRRPIKSAWPDIHWMCHFASDYPHDITPGLGGMKFPPGPDARDLFNFNVIQSWLNGICE